MRLESSIIWLGKERSICMCVSTWLSAFKPWRMVLCAAWAIWKCRLIIVSCRASEYVLYLRPTWLSLSAGSFYTCKILQNQIQIK